MSIQFARRDACRAVQHGQALLVMLAMLVIGAITVFYALFSPTSLTLDRDKVTAAAMAEVKQALIGWSAARATTGSPPNARPGELPCPDLRNDGFEDGNCTAGALGRVPWKTLGIPEPKDGWGETLWYAIAGPFRIWNVNKNPINSDTRGDITVHLNSTATVLTNEAVAVIFSPGPVLQRGDSATIQDRSCAGDSNLPNCNSTRVCSAPHTATALCNPVNYLDVTGGADNAMGPFIQAPDSQTLPSSPPPAPFNDRLLIITNADLMPVVETRVAGELRKILQAYKANTACVCKNLGGTAGCYPWADVSDGKSDAPPFETVGTGRNRGRIPAASAAPYDWGASVCALPVPTLPAWFIDNNWRLVIYYSAGRNYLGPGACSTCETGQTSLRVDGIPGTEVVILTPGPIMGTAPRAPVPLDDSTYWQYYLEDGENYGNNNDRYVVPTSKAYTRDRIFTIP